MKKETRRAVFDKFGGLCAYTGKPLVDDWQVDHVQPLCDRRWRNLWAGKDKHHIDNLVPAIKIINHYKRADTLESFRTSMMGFHKRLAKLPKKTQRPQTVRRIAYMNKVAALFGITTDKPFSGKFYFETIS
jgi:5-methylcytosine-specific restriction endonuclease McrA